MIIYNCIVKKTLECNKYKSIVIRKEKIMIEEILEYNKKFVDEKEYEKYATDKLPNKKLAIVTCMDTRLTELLPAALGLKNGDAKIIRNAGGTIVHPFGSAVRSLLVAIYELGVTDIMVIGHTECGAQHMNMNQMVEAMKKSGIEEETINNLKYFGVDMDRWLGGFDCVEESVAESVDLLRNHPLIPKEISVHGFVIETHTGKITAVD